MLDNRRTRHAERGWRFSERQTAIFSAKESRVPGNRSGVSGLILSVDEPGSLSDGGMSELQLSVIMAGASVPIDDELELVERAKRDRQAFALLYRR